MASYIYHNGDTNTYFGFSGADTYTLVTGGTTALTVNSSQAATFAGDVQAAGLYVGSTNTSFDFYNNGTSYLNGTSTLNGAVTMNSELTINNNASDNDKGIHIKNDTDAYGGAITFWTEYGGTDTNIARVQGGTNGSNGILYLQTANTSKVLTTALSLDYNQDAVFKGSVSIQSDNDNRFLVRSNDYTISRIISRGNTGTNLDKGLFSLMSSDGTNNNIEQVRIDSAGNSWFNGGNVGVGIVSPSGLLHLHKSGSGTDNTIITEDDARRIYIGRDSIKATDLSNNAALLHIQQNDGDARFGGDITVDGDAQIDGGDMTIVKQNGSPTINMLRDSNDPGTGTLLHYLNFQVDYGGSHQDWGGIEHRTTTSATRTKLNFNVKSTSGNVLNALSLDGTTDGTTATFAGDVLVSKDSP